MEKPHAAGQERVHPPAFLYFLAATAFLCGAMVMVVEVLGSRVVGPFFGVSLFVWTSLITVTLIALAAGYALGGVLADRWPSPDVLYGLVLSSGLLVLLVPFLRVPVLKASLPLGLRGGALVSSLVLFGPPLVLLGCVSPYIIRVAARELRSIGRTVGTFYALSTVGSFIGTVLTGFVLITLLGVGRIFTIVGILLVCLGTSWFIFFRRKWVVLLALLPFLLPLRTEVKRVLVRPSGTKVEVIHSSDGFYGNVKVVDYSAGSTRTRELAIDGFIQSGIDMSSGQSVYGYPYLLQLLPSAMNPRGRSCLVIGLGAGIVPGWYSRRGVSVDVVDIDPRIVAIARRYFGYSPEGEVFVADARYHLQRSEKHYDYILLDVFTGDTTPGHLLSVEALDLVRRRLAPGGIVAANIIGSLGERAFATASVIRTFEAVFSSVACYPLFEPRGEKGYGNIVIVASASALPEPDPLFLSRQPLHPFAAEEVRLALGRRWLLPPSVPAAVLTDDFNPLDVEDLWLRESLRRDTLSDTDADVLL